MDLSQETWQEKVAKNKKKNFVREKCSFDSSDKQLSVKKICASVCTRVHISSYNLSAFYSLWMCYDCIILNGYDFHSMVYYC